MKILITGSHGFVGTHLVKALEGQHEILRWDILSEEPLPEVDVVIHLAAKVHDTKHTTTAEEYFRVNTELTKKLYDQFLRSSAQKFIFFSSIKAQDGDTPYAISKREAEECLIKNLEFRIKRNKKIYILRPCMIYGKGMKGNLLPLLKMMRHEIPWPLAAFENQRSFVSIDNVTYVVEALITRDVPSGIYPISDDEPMSTNDLVMLIRQCQGRPCRMWSVPRGLVRLLARVGDVIKLPLNSERLKKLTENYVVDNQAIKTALKIPQMPVGIQEGMKRFIQEMIENP